VDILHSASSYNNTINTLITWIYKKTIFGGKKVKWINKDTILDNKKIHKVVGQVNDTNIQAN